MEMLFSTSLVAIVGMGDQPALSPRRLKIMNTKRESTICELTFPTAILKVKMNRKRLVVVLEEQVYIYDISNMKLLHTIETAPNPRAVCALSPSSDKCFFIYPSGAPFIVNIHHINGLENPADANTTNRSGEVTVFDAMTLQPVNVIEAHKSPISVTAISNDGTLMATASDKGTIIRVFSLPSGTLLHKFRRGTYPSKVFSINFNLSSTLLAVSSATQTVHIFRLRGDPTEESAGDIDTSLGDRTNSGRMRKLAGYLPNVGDLLEPKVRDFAYFKLPGSSSTQSVIAINHLHHVMAVTSDGYFYQYSIDMESGGECQMVRQYSLDEHVG